MDVRAYSSGYGAHLHQLIALAKESGERNATLSLVDAAITKLHKEYRFTGEDKPHIERPFFATQLMNLESHDFQERLISIVTITLCAFSIVGLIFILVAIPIHLHYHAAEKKLASLIEYKRRIGESKGSLDNTLKKGARLLIKEHSRSLQSPYRRPYLTIPRYPRREVSSPALEILPTTAADIPSFHEFFKQVVDSRVIPLAQPTQGDLYFTLRTRASGLDTDDFLIESIVERAIHEDDSNHKTITEHPIVCYPYENKGGSPNGIILHVYHERGAGSAPSLEIWYPDKVDRQNLMQYSILRVDLIEKRRGDSRKITREDLQELQRYVAEVKSDRSGNSSRL